MNFAHQPKRRYASAWDWNMAADGLLQPTRIAATDPDEFMLEAEAATVNDVRLAVVTSSGMRVERTRAVTATTPVPRFTLSLQLDGNSRLLQSGNESLLAPGSLSITDSALPFVRADVGRNTSLVIIFPQQLVNLPPRALSRLIGVGIPGEVGVAPILVGFLRSVAANLAALRTPMALTVVDSAIELATAFLAEAITTPDETSRATDLTLQIAICGYIMEHLGDSEMTATNIASAHFISIRKLQLIFNRLGTTPTRWIRDRRLDMARRNLADPLNAEQTVGEIAQRWGFESASHFGRLFRAEYGVTPRDYRQAALPTWQAGLDKYR